jgi:ABC-2 type transport system ATP-binding protein
MIRVNNISKNFSYYEKEHGLKGSLHSLFWRQKKEKQALKDISFSVSPGEIVGLIGENGAGKTTLTKILSGIIKASSGEVTILGHDPWLRHNDYRKQMSVIMGQKAQLWWDLPALDGLYLLKEIYQISPGDFNSRLNFLAECLNIKKELKTQVRKLSLGERMKVELLAALIHHPKVIFLDEPTIGLDLSAQKAIRDFLLFYKEKFRPMMILTSHYMEDIEKLCPRILVLNHGQLVYDGSMQTVLEKYAKTKKILVRLENDFQFDQKQINHFEQLLESQLNLKLQDVQFNYKKEISSLEFTAVKENSMALATEVLKYFPVIDLNMTEEPVSQIIEKMMGHRKL